MRKRICGKRFPLLLTIPFLLLILSTPARAQSTATLQGAVTDPKGDVIPNANVVVHNQATGLERTIETDSDGNYQVAALPVGMYRIQVQSQGFQTQVVNDVNIEVGQTV